MLSSRHCVLRHQLLAGDNPSRSALHEPKARVVHTDVEDNKSEGGVQAEPTREGGHQESVIGHLFKDAVTCCAQ